MARPLRLQFPGAHYHVISRGNARQWVFTEDADFAAFTELLGKVCGDFAWHCHAHCLMGNHYHLVIETPRANLAAGMRQLNGVFTQRYNRRHGRVGHLFQGRYAAPLVQPGTQLLEVVRYVLLNPVRARMVESPAEWPWSSCRWLLGKLGAPVWAKPAALWRCFDASGGRSIPAMEAFLAEGQHERVPGWSRDGILGDDAFKVQVTALLERSRDTREHAIRARFADRPSLEALFAQELQDLVERDRRMLMAVREWHYTQAEVAGHLGLSPPTVSRILRRLRAMS